MEKKIVGVRFNTDGSLSDKEYAYFTREELKVNDWVIVVVNLIPKTAIVTSLEEDMSKLARDKSCKWIAQKVDLTEYNRIIEKERRISQIENALDDALVKANRYEMFKRMASSSPEIKRLLDELQSLDSSINLISE